MEDTPASFSCSDCQRQFPSFPELSRHCELLHPHSSQDLEEADPISRPYRCQQCGRGYRHPGSLVNHRRTHETGLFPCSACGKDFTNPMALKSHLRTHTPEGRHRCRPPRPRETALLLQDETVASDSWDQSLGPGDSWGTQKHVQETSGHESGPDPRTAPGTWEDPVSRQTEAWDSPSPPETQEGTEDWATASNSPRAPPLPTPASSLLSNLEQYLAESVVNFTGGQEPTTSPPAEEERRYKCSQCGKTYKHAGSLTNHRQSHTLGVYPCAVCFKEFSNLMALKNHSRLHAQYRPYQCPRCPRAFRLPRELLEHQQAHDGERPWEEQGQPTNNGHVDESGGGRFPSIQTLNGSGEPEDNGLEEYRPFRCGDCGRTYRHAGSLINHRKSHQTGVYPCAICSKQLFNAAALKNHVRAHHRPRPAVTGEDRPPGLPSSAQNTPREKEASPNPLDHRPYKCNECGRAYRHRGSLVNHRHSHRTGEYQCSLCPRKYPNLMALRNHVRIHCKVERPSGGPGLEGTPSNLRAELPDPAREKANPQTDQKVEATASPQAAVRAVPRECGEHFADPESLEHRGQSHEEGVDSRTEGRVSPPRAFACRDCGKSYRHSGSLINHRQTHQTGDFSCGTCAKHFHTMAAMKNHLRRHSRRWSRRHGRRVDIEAAGAETAGAQGGHWPRGSPQGDVKALGYSQNPSGESPARAEGSSDNRRDCFQAESERQKHELESVRKCFQSERESAGERLKRREGSFPDNPDEPGDVDGHRPHFENLTAQDEPQNTTTGPSGSLLQSAEAVSGWQEEASHTCPDCGQSFPHATSLLNHRPCHPPGIYQCSLCPKEFDSLPALRIHFQSHGPGEAAAAQPFLCSLCGMIFPGRAGYRLHRRQAHGSAGSEEDGEEDAALGVTSADGPPLQLSEAELLNQLQREVEALDGAGYGHICGCCGQTYDDLGSLERHHQSQSAGNTTAKSPSPPILGGLCDTAGLAAGSSHEDAARQHVDAQPGGASTIPPDGPGSQGEDTTSETQPRPFRCNQCGKTYRHGGSLVNHRKIHQTGSFTCPACSRCYPNLAAYRNHLRNHPLCKGSQPRVGPSPEAIGSEEPQVAEEVPEQPRQAKLQEELKVEPPDEAERAEVWETMVKGEEEEVWETIVKGEEETDLHSDKSCLGETSAERPFSCEVCGRSYKHAGSLINHRQSHQTGHFGCQACSKGFSNLMSLKNHRRIHADPRRFCCTECGKAFRLRKQLASHQRVHTERGAAAPRKLSQEDGPFRCGHCGRTYRHASSLLNHRRSHEPGQCGGRSAVRDQQRLHLESRRRRRMGRSRRAALRCALCGRRFPSRGSLERHLREHERAGSAQGDAEGLLVDTQGLGSHSDCCESVDQLAGGISRPDEPRPGPETTEPEPCGLGKVDECQGGTAPVNHNGQLPWGYVLTKLGDGVPRSPCRLGDRPPSGPLSRAENVENGTSSPQPSTEPQPFFSHRGPACQSGDTQNHSSHHPDHRCCLLCSTGGHIHTAAQAFQCSPPAPVRDLHHGEQARGPRAATAEGEVALLSEDRAQKDPSEPPQSPGENPTNSPGGPGVVSADEERPFRCGQCGRSYRHAGSLLNHQKAHTTGLYPCSLCPKLLPNLLSLKNHGRTHTDPKRHRCGICGKGFRTAARLEGHRRVHAPREGPLACPHCPRRFRRRLSFLQHQQQHQEEWAVTNSGAPKAPASGRGALALSPPPTSTAPLLDSSPQWPADLSYSL